MPSSHYLILNIIIEKKVLEESPFLLKLAKKGDFEAVETIEFRVKNNLRRVREQTKNNPELEKQYARKIQRREEVWWRTCGTLDCSHFKF